MLSIKDGKIVNENGEFVRPELGNPEHIKLIKSVKKAPKPKICSKCFCHTEKKPFKIQEQKPDFRLTIKGGKIYDENKKVVALEIGNAEHIALLKWSQRKKKKAQYLCAGCAAEAMRFKNLSK